MVDTPEFEEDFNRTFVVPSKEQFIYLIKGFCLTKDFSARMVQNATRHYLLLNFYCSGQADGSADMIVGGTSNKRRITCPFYVQYVQSPYHPQIYKLHSSFGQHNHKLISWTVWIADDRMTNYFMLKKAPNWEYKEHQRTPFKNSSQCWKHHFLRSVEYEISVIHGDEFRYRQQRVADNQRMGKGCGVVTVEQRMIEPM
jgi:hypothetical protein